MSGELRDGVEWGLGEGLVTRGRRSNKQVVGGERYRVAVRGKLGVFGVGGGGVTGCGWRSRRGRGGWEAVGKDGPRAAAAAAVGAGTGGAKGGRGLGAVRRGAGSAQGRIGSRKQRKEGRRFSRYSLKRGEGPCEAGSPRGGEERLAAVNVLVDKFVTMSSWCAVVVGTDEETTPLHSFLRRRPLSMESKCDTHKQEWEVVDARSFLKSANSITVPVMIFLFSETREPKRGTIAGRLRQAQM